MHNNITQDDKDALIRFIRKAKRFTNGEKVVQFEEAWSKWLGVKHSVFVNSGASANLLTMQYLANLECRVPVTEVYVPALTWVSDISSVLHAGMEPIIRDIDPYSLGIEGSFNPNIPVFVTHILGLVAECKGVSFDNLIEDCCEAHGATYSCGAKVGTRGFISNFSFYFAHHMTTIEGGMICTNDEQAYESFRMLRSHGMTREMHNEEWKKAAEQANPNVHPSFLFKFPAFNCRSTEINAVLGLNQLKRLDENNEERKKNLDVFLNELDHKLYRTHLATHGSSPYALILIMNEPDVKLRNRIEKLLTLCGVEFRRGLSGGGNQLRQPYLRKAGYKWHKRDYKQVEHITDFSWYIGNYPGLPHKKIKDLCRLLNQF